MLNPGRRERDARERTENNFHKDEEANLENMPNCGSFETEQVVVSKGALREQEMSNVDKQRKHWSNAPSISQAIN